MKYVIGIDLGTSAMKMTMTDTNGKVIKHISESYSISLPQKDYCEQDPEQWKTALLNGLKRLNEGIDGEVIGISIDGQMHGLITLDKDYKVIRPCILWNDSRSKDICYELNHKFTEKRFLDSTGNIAYPGFTLPKILWLRKYERENYEKIAHILLPKDYLNFVLTHRLATDFSDASGSLILDTKNRCWSTAMMSLAGLNEKQLPELMKTGTDLGKIDKDIANSCNISLDCHIYQGTSDNVASAISNGVIENECNISLGTSGTLLIPTKEYPTSDGTIHTFCFPLGMHCLLSCSLSAASSLNWLNNSILKTNDYEKEQKNINETLLGHNPVFFLPYLTGERSPINDPNAKGAFVGLSLDTNRENLTLAVLEGVSFALKESYNKIKSFGVNINKAFITGGGTKSQLWMKILSSVLNIPLIINENNYGPSFGMCMILLHQLGFFSSVEEMKNKLLKIKEIVNPNLELVKLYKERYEIYKKIYPSLKELF